MVDALATFKKYTNIDGEFDHYNILDDCLEFVRGDLKVKVAWSDVVRADEEEERLPVVEVGYQRKNMTKEFYEVVLGGGVSGVCDNTTLNKIKKMTVSSDCELNRWELNDNEFIDFCW